MNDLVYIYNLAQANYYLRKGVLPVRVDVHKRTKKVYLVFRKSDTEEVYTKWCLQKTC